MADNYNITELGIGTLIPAAVGVCGASDAVADWLNLRSAVTKPPKMCPV
jgi:hypothetical protein